MVPFFFLFFVSAVNTFSALYNRLMTIIKSHSVSFVCVEMAFSIYNWLEILRKMRENKKKKQGDWMENLYGTCVDSIVLNEPEKGSLIRKLVSNNN